MTKTELIRKVAEKTGKTQAEVKKVIDETISAIASALENGERVAIPDLGVFNVQMRKARKGRNPRTGKEINIPARKVVVFRVAKAIKERVK